MRADVVIIGGGIIGLTCAYELARRDVDVIVAERNARLGREGSWASLGLLRQRVTSDDPYGRIARYSADAYPDLAASVHEDSGIDPEYRRRGGLEVAVTEEKLASLGRFMTFHASRGLAVEWLEPQDIQAFEPVLSDACLGAILYADDAYVRPPRMLQALEAAFVARGGRVVTKFAASRIGRGIGVTVESGRDTLHAGTVVIAAGAWSGLLERDVGLFLPVRPVRGQALMYDAPPEILRRACGVEKTYVAQRDDGVLLVGSTREDVGFDSSTSAEGIADLKRRAAVACPALGEMDPARAWAGLRPAPARRFPYIGEVESNVWVATGHHRYGYMLAPGTARVVADGITAVDTPIPLDDFHPERDRARVEADQSGS
ncbi:FAD-dependent oxidoreductase [Candidatus Poribacteria bacterium]|nr:FAD-dependent oxidoreductase [Candidatus Poribacteria bacterium]